MCRPEAPLRSQAAAAAWRATPPAPRAGAYDTGSRDYLRPFYVSCIHLPTLSQQGVSGGCDTIHQRSSCDYKNALDSFRTAASITVDASQCARYLTPKSAADGYVDLKPVELALRPGSTDHDVFLQARGRPAACVGRTLA